MERVLAYLKNRIADLELDKANLYAQIIALREENEKLKKTETAKENDK